MEKVEAPSVPYPLKFPCLVCHYRRFSPLTPFTRTAHVTKPISLTKGTCGNPVQEGGAGNTNLASCAWSIGVAELSSVVFASPRHGSAVSFPFANELWKEKTAPVLIRGLRKPVIPPERIRMCGRHASRTLLGSAFGRGSTTRCSAPRAGPRHPTESKPPRPRW
jgi:hypothetical protein